MRLDNVLDVVIGKAQQNREGAFHAAKSRIQEGEVVVAPSAAVTLLDARPVILGKGDAEGLLHLCHLLSHGAASPWREACSRWGMVCTASARASRRGLQRGRRDLLDVGRELPVERKAVEKLDRGELRLPGIGRALAGRQEEQRKPFAVVDRPAVLLC